MQGELPSKEEIAFLKGFWGGAEWILDNPDKALQSFESALKKAQALTEED